MTLVFTLTIVNIENFNIPKYDVCYIFCNQLMEGYLNYQTYNMCGEIVQEF
jgi:hypothetical protein